MRGIKKFKFKNNHFLFFSFLFFLSLNYYLSSFEIVEKNKRGGGKGLEWRFCLSKRWQTVLSLWHMTFKVKDMGLLHFECVCRFQQVHKLFSAYFEWWRQKWDMNNLQGDCFNWACCDFECVWKFQQVQRSFSV